MDTKVVKQMVKQFVERTGSTSGEAHCFAPWYLHNKFQLPEGKALEQASDGNFDFGIDAFFLLAEGDGKPTLVLVQAGHDDLFSRNVRYYLKSKKNTERGPAGKMRATLKQMCVEGSVDPERFAMYHNGITMFSRHAQLVDGEVRLRDPYVLNGCQTIKNAFFFRYDKSLTGKVKEELWSRVVVPVRIVETADEDLIRAVTVNNNRQNAMSSAALRANDPVQIRLEQRFKERHILYQRQEGAFDAVWLTRPEMLEDEYENTQGTWVDIHDIARAIAGAAGEVRPAQKPNDLFESDAAYNRCFDEKKCLQSIALLTFLQNVHDTLGLVLKKDLGLSPRAGGPKVGRFTYHVMCLLMRYLAREEMGDFILALGGAAPLSKEGLPRGAAQDPELEQGGHPRRGQQAVHDPGVQ